ncbi:MAG TPA: DUF202 domain-containing protein [Nocardioidaceae bacterium]|nr:DUF202 domain-containing protein [Nocardioidaceae bacterium]
MGQTSDPDGAALSRTRDLLASERTYLAWLRTAANVMVLGLAIAQFARSGGTAALAAGAVLIAVGAVGLLYGTLRYRRVNSEIEGGRPITGHHGLGPAVASAVLFVAVLVALTLLIVAGAGSDGSSG